MRESFGDIWELAGSKPLPIVCVTTNLQVSNTGRAIMGAGIALEAREKFPGLDKVYGRNLAKNRSAFFMGAWSDEYGLKYTLIMFPTKDHWRDNSIPKLIVQSAIDLTVMVDALGLQDIHLPRPGCGMGGLKWENVKPLLDEIMDDRFIAVGFRSEKG